MVGVVLEAEDFTLRHFGQGPVTLHTVLTVEGKGARLVAAASKDSGSPIDGVQCSIFPTDPSPELQRIQRGNRRSTGRMCRTDGGKCCGEPVGVVAGRNVCSYAACLKSEFSVSQEWRYHRTASGRKRQTNDHFNWRRPTLRMDGEECQGRMAGPWGTLEAGRGTDQA